jgi:hypothetical protein
MHTFCSAIKSHGLSQPFLKKSLIVDPDKLVYSTLYRRNSSCPCNNKNCSAFLHPEAKPSTQEKLFSINLQNSTDREHSNPQAAIEH